MIKLFLDDIRYPSNCSNYMHTSLVSLYNEKDWVIVRTYDEFVDYITKHGLPDLISFDHDIEEDQIDGDINDLISCKIQYGKTGNDCAKWLVKYCVENKKPIPAFIIHSSNPVGAENILNSLKDYERIIGSSVTEMYLTDHIDY